MEKEHFLNHIREIISLSGEEFDEIWEYFSIKNIRKKQFLVQEYQTSNEVYWVASGIFKSSFFDTDGKEHILQFASSGWWTGDFSAFYKQQKTRLSIECLENGSVLAITQQNMDILCQKFPLLERFFRIKTNFGYIALQERIISLMTQSAKQRYQNFLKQYPHLVQKLPKQTIASYLGVSRETLSRLSLEE
ncbi:Crp/Fnr family transcriptional regulator [Riemerella anatipestifer]|uniref:Crp/Fnr family transcriptional regulator n=1 Tax=Riemerella anatipestifer TaxID=34085 RepID=UPI0021B0E6A9|nr:Crp/Fnr family transcriptional regulator [Riemerella anatipestifer]MCT6744204.1 Crp/Fnr family transcriptional regulator [Riemerella anatipestifer]MCU7571754.1 Crp/Fnr family transcriptional regulator [Riemerella anatipestifer]MCU7603942.1 Crp/Fnr family transcriptional regulator [Riemerella anatipestifer]MDY3370269.1 Crp/Fnr family transcriptional regulator [Riemerella anatipestifer]MDY3387681.1 Crp/Fnr family transcriptional regulator [Riemerella anatipestifer]